MDDDLQVSPIHSFTLRLWPEQVEDGQFVWRGRVQDTADGEVRYFQGWEALREMLIWLTDGEARSAKG